MNRQRQINKEALLESLLNNDDISSFFVKHDLSALDGEQALLDLKLFVDKKAVCASCNGLKECPFDIKGLTPYLEYNQSIKLAFEPCHYQKESVNANSRNQRLTSFHMPKELLNNRLADFDLTRAEIRLDISREISLFLNDLKLGEPVQGMYLTGQYGQGKTFILSALANELADLGVDVAMAYVPDLFRELKSSIGTKTLETHIRKLKSVSVLMLDDIGGESYSAWIRDEILGPILQYRLLDHKPTFFSSNLSMNSLKNHYLGNDSKEEKIKSFRIVDRIQNLVGNKEYKL